jgi:hypothetical protein
MATTVYATGFEHQAPFTTNGGGLYSLVLGTWTTDTSIKHTGNASAKVAVASGAAADIRINKGLGSGTVVTATVYVNFGASLPGGSVVLQLLGTVNSPASNFPNVCYNPSTGFFGAQCGTLNRQEDNVTVQTNTWYKIDFLAQITGGGTNQTLDVKIDGRALTQVSTATTTTSYATFFLGTTRTDHAVAFNVYYDDLVISATAADYPLSGTNQIGFEGLKPSSDGTHNAGTNTMEDNAGTDIGTTTAYDKLNSAPPDATVYIRQATIGTGNYAEVLFADITATHSAICCAMATLAYTSASTAVNKGACIVSKDSFSTNTEVWGNPTTTADYSDGATNNLFFKTAIIAGATDDTTVNALKARVGYSGDVTPNPYWIDLIVEVGYFYSTGGNFTQTVSGGMTPSGAVAKQGNKTVSGGITSIVGSVAKAVSKFFGGGNTPSGAVAKQTSKTFSGAISSIVGTLSTSKFVIKLLGGSLTPSGDLSKLSSKTFDGTLTSGGAIAKLANKVLSGSITSIVGTLVTSRLVSKILDGSITPSGNVIRLSTKTFDGTLTSSGGLAKQTAKLLSGAISVITGTLSKASGKILSGNITPSGTSAKLSQKTFTGNLTPSGLLSKLSSKSLDGTVTSSGSISKAISKFFTGVLTWAGDVASQLNGGAQTFFQSVGGTLTSSGTIVKDTFRTLAGAILPSGTLSKLNSISVSGTLTSAGTVAKSVIKLLSGILTSVGTISSQFVSGGQQFLQSVGGALGLSGEITKQATKALSGTLASSGSFLREISKFVGGTLTSAGQVSRGIFIQLVGNLLSSGIVSRVLNPILARIQVIRLAGSAFFTTRLSGISSNPVLSGIYNKIVRLLGTYRN